MIRKVLIVFILVVNFQILFSQIDSNSNLIKLRQRLVHIKHEEGKETVDSFRFLHLMIGGNVYQTEKHLKYAYDETAKKYDFRNEFKYIQPILNLGDISIVNLKTSFGNNVKNMFSSPDEFALALKYAGINVLMHANIHTANISKAMLKRTRDLVNVYDMYHTGAFTDNMQRNGNYPLIINQKGFRIAIINYTRITNRPSISRDFVVNEIDKSVMERDMRMAQIQKPDFIIAYFDWGANNQDAPNYMQMDIVQYAFQLGANFVVGTNPNTPMRIDYVNYSRNGIMKQGIVAYSLGNLVASNDEVQNRRGYVIDLELKKNNYTSETDINDWGAIPVYTYYDTTSTHGSTKIFSVPCANVESGDIFPKIPYIEKRRAVNCAYEVRKLLGATADEIQYNLTELAVNNVQETIDLTSASLNNKFSQKRASEIEPTDAPVLPITAIGSNNPPSLAVLYDEQPNVDPQSEKTMSKSKTSGQETLLTTAQKVEPTDLNRAPNHYPQSDDSASRNKSVACENKVDGIGNNNIGKDISTKGSSSTERSVNKTSSQTNISTKKEEGKRPEQKERERETAIEINHKTEVEAAKSNKSETGSELQKVIGVNSQVVFDTIYRIQFYALKKFIPLDTNYYTHLKGYEVMEEAGLFKYLLGSFKTKQECDLYWKTQIQPRYKQSFVIKYTGNKRLPE